MKQVCVFLLLCSILALPNAAVSQTVWFKYEGNPVMSCGAAGAWDDYMLAPNRVIFENSIYRMWYTGGDGSYWRTGIATSPDGAHWTKSDRNPVLDVGPASWDAGASYEGFVIKVDGGYKMWYTGMDASSNWKLGYAFSTDGIAWVKANGANPVLGTGSWYAKGPHNPSVLGPDSIGGYKMWFQGNPLAHADVQIGYATATSETTWTAMADPVFSFGTPGSWDDDKVMDPKILFDGQRYEMLYAGEQSDGITEIGYATSPDGLNWTRYNSNPVMGRGPLAWDQSDLYCLDIFFDGSLYHMWYGGRRVLTSPIEGVGYAVSPKGMSYAVSTNGDSVLVIVRVPGASGLSFSAELKSPDENPVDTLDLFDDGTHGDSLALDGVFATGWKVLSAGTYYVDLTLELDTLKFELNNADTVSVLGTSVAQLVSEIPSSFSLLQNFPNPFNPATTISYQLSEATHVRLTVFNLLGSETAVLVDAQKPAGTHRAAWNAAGFASGVYFYRLQAGDFTETKKLLLMR